MTLSYYLVLAAILFTIGAVGVLVRRNAIVVFMCVELMLNAVNLTLITFARSTLLRRPGGLTPSRPASPPAAYRLRHKLTVGRVTPTRSAIS